MEPISRIAVAAALAAVVTLCGGCGEPERYPAIAGGDDTVVGVSDGDTISLAGVGKTRLIGLDTPEVFGEAECYGPEASRFTKRLLPHGTRVRYRLGVEPRDAYGRALAYVWLPDGRMVNLLLTEGGYAKPLRIPPNVDYADRFVAAANRARQANRGLWGESGCADGERDTAQ